jgi:hypothetical protein
LVEVLGGHGPAQFRRGLQDGLGDVALVEPGLTLFGNDAERVRQIRVAKELARSRRFAVWQIYSPALSIRRQVRRGVFPVGLDDFRHSVTMPGIEDRRLKQLAPGKLAKLVVKLGPPVDGSGYGHRVNARLGHGVNAFRLQVIDCQALGSPAAGVQSVQLAGLRVPVDGKQVAADAIHHRLGNAKDRVRGDAGIDGGTALFKDAGAGLRCLHIAGGHDAVGCNHHGAAIGAVFCGSRGRNQG